jgi:hypothetical protein
VIQRPTGTKYRNMKKTTTPRKINSKKGISIG